MTLVRIYWTLIIAALAGVILYAYAASAQTQPRGVVWLIDGKPAVTEENKFETICKPGWSTEMRLKYLGSKASAMKRKAIAEQSSGSDRNPQHYEWDHSGPIELGFSPFDPDNLWLEARFGPFNALEKDKIEDALHREVCAVPQVTNLVRAQAIFLIPDAWKQECVRRGICNADGTPVE